MAAAAGCSAVALTDHDSLDGLAEARAAAGEAGGHARPGLRGLVPQAGRRPPGRPAIGGSVHVLVYFVEPGEGPLQDELVAPAPRPGRAQRPAPGPAGRAGGARRLRRHGGRGRRRGGARPAPFRPGPGAGRGRGRRRRRLRPLPGRRARRLCPKARLSPADVARAGPASGGVAVLAHPLSLGLDPSAPGAVGGELAEAGLGGIEAIYGRYTHRRAPGAATDGASAAALVATGGSDYHGTFKPDLEVGTGHGRPRRPRLRPRGAGGPLPLKRRCSSGARAAVSRPGRPPALRLRPPGAGPGRRAGRRARRRWRRPPLRSRRPSTTRRSPPGWPRTRAGMPGGGRPGQDLVGIGGAHEDPAGGLREQLGVAVDAAHHAAHPRVRRRTRPGPPRGPPSETSWTPTTRSPSATRSATRPRRAAVGGEVESGEQSRPGGPGGRRPSATRPATGRWRPGGRGRCRPRRPLPAGGGRGRR